MTRLVSLLLSIILLSPSFAFAASGETVTGLAEKDRAARTKEFYSELLKSRKADAAYREALQHFREGWVEARRACRKDLHRVNRDTKVPTLLRCMRAETTLQREIALQERSLLDVTPGVTKAVRAEAAKAQGEWLAALDAILAGLDANLFGSEADLRETKQNLRTRYLAPLLQARLLLRADRALSWVAFLHGRLAEARTEKEAASETLVPEWETARICLGQEEQPLLNILTLQATDRSFALTESLSRLQTCSSLLQSLSSLYSAPKNGHAPQPQP